MKIVCISDLHNYFDKLEIPECDILICAGDLTGLGTMREIIAFNNWISNIKQAKHRIVIAGNHDWLFQKQPSLARSLMTGCTYLQDEMVTVEGLKIYGSPWQPWFCDWAFNEVRGKRIKEKWDRIPENVDILVTHGPPQGILDTVHGEHVGCEELLKAIQRVQPRLHVFGHIHYSYGKQVKDNTTFVNASVCTEEYSPLNKPVLVEL
jgi:Icc-related predicted phosphoesterase